MLALCLMLLATYYALNYAGIIGRCLVNIHAKVAKTGKIQKLPKLDNTSYNPKVAKSGK